ncbi:MAG: glutamate-5-semialdehyde dehydrogenase [Parvularculaceae bacterium]|nr:glutamate-5-semialdehyde dehydrogenase [Parvularculaceae bacterium]
MLDMTDDGINALVEDLCLAARKASRALAVSSPEAKDQALRLAAQRLRDRTAELVEANAADVRDVEAAGKSGAFVDRLRLTPERVEAVAVALEEIAELPHPLGRTLASTTRPNGLVVDRVAVPIGVIGMIYESRPNVGADAGALCLKSGNAVILRGGSESARSTEVIVGALQEGIAQAGLPAEVVQKMPTTDRRAVASLLGAVGLVDLVIPRGGKGLVSLVRDQARVPTLLHLDGNCHTYIHAAANPEKAAAIVKNAKLRRTGVCGATESLVIDRSMLAHLPLIIDGLDGCELRGDEAAQAADPRVGEANEIDWSTEYLEAVLSIKTVDGLDEALQHIATHSSSHTDAIVTEDEDAATRFLADVDSAVVMHNASTQFSDGGEFGMGAEIGIATGRIHARGPVGLEQLTTFKYTVRGTGQIRP